MPYRRRFPVRRRRRRSPWYKRRYNAQQLARYAYSGVKYLKGIINSEKKHFTTQFSAATVSGSGAMVSLQDMAQGDTNITRNGNSILVRGVYLFFKTIINPSVTTVTQVRYILVQDNQQVGDTGPSVTDLLQDASYLSMLNTNTAGRFKILWSKLYSLSVAAAGSPSVITKKYINLKHHIRYNGSGSGDIQKGGLYLLCISSESSNTPTVNGNIRLTYYDN